jgi:hypothetical protein
MKKSLNAVGQAAASLRSQNFATSAHAQGLLIQQWPHRPCESALANLRVSTVAVRQLCSHGSFFQLEERAMSAIASS